MPESKQQSTVSNFQYEPSPTKVLAHDALRNKWSFVFFRETDNIATVPVENHRTKFFRGIRKIIESNK